MLPPYRVLDLSGELGMFCGRILAELGCEVFVVEPPNGHPVRNTPPFVGDQPGPDSGILWFTLNAGKKSVTLDLSTPDGRNAFLELVASAHFVIESSSPGAMAALGLDYAALSSVNSSVILTSITPFGQTGPHSGYAASDLVVSAMGGWMYVCGEPDRPPVRFSAEQVRFQAGAQAAAATLIAHYHRQQTGEGQHVDVSAQEAVIWTLGAYAVPSWFTSHRVLSREGAYLRRNDLRFRRLFPCKDGYVSALIGCGAMLGPMFQRLVALIDRDGLARDMAAVDWANTASTALSQEQIDRWESHMDDFFGRYTRAQLRDMADEHNLYTCPVNQPPDIFADPQTEALDCWREMTDEVTGSTFRYPSRLFRSTAANPGPVGRAPRLGEHNSWLAELQGKKRRMASPAGPLEGLTVLDLSWVLTGPTATKYLADHGARVIKLEWYARPDEARTYLPFKDDVPGANRSAAFAMYNAGKLGMTLDLRHPSARRVMERLVPKVDIVVETFAPGTLERLGYGYEELKKLRPDVIMASMTMQGRTGPSANRPTFGAFFQAVVGFGDVIGWPDRPPSIAQSPYTDFIAPWFLITAILAALDRRRETGQGCWVDLTQMETGLQFLAPALIDYASNGRVATREGNRAPAAAPHGAYACRGHDRWCVIAASNDDEWRRLSEAIGKPEWAADPRLASLGGRKQHEDFLDQTISEWASGRSPEEVVDALQAVAVPCGIVQSARDLVENDPQLRDRGFFQAQPHAELGEHITQMPAFRLSRTPARIQSAAPLLGEHNEFVYKQLLGFSDEEFVELLSEGVMS
jgi:crotonobetainyl-CoA:carnitine CoA-transferase CaiB-like acyl-CoA transferase